MTDNDLRLIHLIADYLEAGYDLKAARALARDHYLRMQNQEVQADFDEDVEEAFR